MNEAISLGALSTLFTDARTHNGWRETPVSDETLREIYALMKWGPTSANCSPARIVFIRTAEGKNVCARRFPAAICKNPDRARHRYRRPTVNFMNGYHYCFPTVMPAVGLPPAHNLPKKQRFATVPCRRLI